MPFKLQPTGYMTLEESLLHAVKMPNRVFMDAKYRWAEILNTLRLRTFRMPN